MISYINLIDGLDFVLTTEIDWVTVDWFTVLVDLIDWIDHFDIF